MREIMDGVERRSRIFDSFRGLEITAGEVVLDAGKAVWVRRRRRLCHRRRWRCGAISAEGAAIFEGRRDGAAAAAVKADTPRIVENIGARGDVDQAGGAQAELRRQRAGDERNAADPAGAQNAAEAADPVRQD